MRFAGTPAHHDAGAQVNHGHGHDDHHQAHYEESASLNAKFKQTSAQDLDYQLPKKI